jgi:hypothetical protein
MRGGIIATLACAEILSLAFAQPAHARTRTTNPNPLATPAATPASQIQTVIEFRADEFWIEVQSAPQTQPVKYLLARNVRYVDRLTGKAIDPRRITPGTRVRLENKSKGRHGKYRRVVVFRQ